jgi:hypothetical protein
MADWSVSYPKAALWGLLIACPGAFSAMASAVEFPALDTIGHAVGMTIWGPYLFVLGTGALNWIISRGDARRARQRAQLIYSRL